MHALIRVRVIVVGVGVLTYVLIEVRVKLMVRVVRLKSLSWVRLVELSLVGMGELVCP